MNVSEKLENLDRFPDPDGTLFPVLVMCRVKCFVFVFLTPWVWMDLIISEHTSCLSA